jgi:hypothetical protein
MQTHQQLSQITLNNSLRNGHLMTACHPQPFLTTPTIFTTQRTTSPLFLMGFQHFYHYYLHLAQMTKLQHFPQLTLANPSSNGQLMTARHL